MSRHEQRIADPVLDDQHENPWANLDRVVAIGDTWSHVPVAHRVYMAGPSGAMYLGPVCGAHRGRHAGDWTIFPVKHARWFARPCRRCYPNAPAPIDHSDTRLDWQVPPRRFRR